MNSDLYTEEFRNFKYLKCSAAAVKYYKDVAKNINSIQPYSEVYDPTFVWKTRLEFVEQLLDLRNDIVYIVEAGGLCLHTTTRHYSYEDARIREIIKPVVFEGHPLTPEEGRIATLDDVPTIENHELNAHFYICPEEYFIGYADIIDVEKSMSIILKFDQNPLVPSSTIIPTAFFYEKEWASKYQVALTKFLRYNADAVSTISNLL